MTKKVVKKDKEELATQEHLQGWGAPAQADSSDLLIPKLFTLNPLSKLVQEQPKKFPAGCIIKSTTQKVVADQEKGVEFIPFYYEKRWKVERKGATKFEFARYEPFTPENATLPWEFQEDGVEHRRNTTLDFFVLLVPEIKEGLKAEETLRKGGFVDPDEMLFPVCISFNRTSYNAGKLLATHFIKAGQFGLPPAAATFSLKSQLQQKDDNRWFSLDVTKAGKTSEDDVKRAFKWYKEFKTREIAVDEDSEPVVEQSVSPSGNQVPPPSDASAPPVDESKFTNDF